MVSLSSPSLICHIFSLRERERERVFARCLMFWRLLQNRVLWKYFPCGGNFLVMVVSLSLLETSKYPVGCCSFPRFRHCLWAYIFKSVEMAACLVEMEPRCNCVSCVVFLTQCLLLTRGVEQLLSFAVLFVNVCRASSSLAFSLYLLSMQ